jgi:CBS domain-containing protein
MNAADVMTPNVISVHSDTSAETIAEILLANRISAVPVLDDSGVLVGIVSEGDLIHRVEAETERHRSWWLELLIKKEVLAREFIKSHARKAADLMTYPVVTVKPSTPLSELAFLLEKHRIKRVPVTDDGKIVGIVSRANLIRALVNRGQEIIPGERVEDSALFDQLFAELKSKPWWSNNVHFNVKNGTVELFGIVDSKTVKDAISVAVEVTPGVRSVSNHIAVKHLRPVD